MNEVKNKFKTIPISLKAANEFVTTHHRHNKKQPGISLVSVQCWMVNSLV